MRFKPHNLFATTATLANNERVLQWWQENEHHLVMATRIAVEMV